MPTGWTTFIGTNGLGTAQNWQHGLYNDNTEGFMFCLYEAAGGVTEDWLVSPSTSITATNSLLSFYERNPYAAAYDPTTMSVRVSTTSQTDISTFTSLSSLTSAEVFNGTTSRTVDLSAYEGETIYIAWVLEQNDTDGWFVDNFILSNKNPSAPDCAENPIPAIDAVDVEVTDGAVAIAWTLPSTGDPATGYELFFGTTSGALYSVGTSSGTSIGITGSSYATTYYWSIIPENAGGSASGCAEWSYITQADPTLSIDDTKIEGLSLFPTIVKQKLNFTSQKTVDVITVFNLLGQQVYTSKPNSTNSSVDLSSLKGGLYMINLRVGDSTGSYKIIKE